MPCQQPTEGQSSFQVVRLRYTHYIEKRRDASTNLCGTGTCLKHTSVSSLYFFSADNRILMKCFGAVVCVSNNSWLDFDVDMDDNELNFYHCRIEAIFCTNFADNSRGCRQILTKFSLSVGCLSNKTRSSADADKPERRHVTYIIGSTSTCKILWRSADLHLRYCALSTFKMAAVRHLGFSYFRKKFKLAPIST